MGLVGKQEKFWSGWRERLLALRHLPPVLAIVWRSGPAVVAFGLVARVMASLLPIALLWVAKLIIDSIVQAVSNHQLVQSRFWWLVAAEFGLAVCASILGRSIDYLDALLADKYTRHVSIQVMKHAAELDLIAYEDPVFYDRLERARVQATDRLGMIQSIGRLVQQVITHYHLSISIMVFSPWLLLMLIAGRNSRVSRGKPFRISWICQEFSPDSNPASTRLPARSRWKQEAAKELKLFGLKDFLIGRFTRLVRSDLPGECWPGAAAADRGCVAVDDRHCRLLLCLRVRHLADGRRSAHDWQLTFLSGAICRPAANIQQISSTLAGIADQALFLTDLLAFFEMQPDDPLQAERVAGAQADRARLRIPQRFVPLSGQVRDWCLNRMNFSSCPGSGWR